jgi:hypothetical protein
MNTWTISDVLLFQAREAVCGRLYVMCLSAVLSGLQKCMSWLGLNACCKIFINPKKSISISHITLVNWNLLPIGNLLDYEGNMFSQQHLSNFFQDTNRAPVMLWAEKWIH